MTRATTRGTWLGWLARAGIAYPTLAGVQLLIAIEMVAYAMWPPISTSPERGDLLRALVMVVLALFSALVAPLVGVRALQSSLAGTWLALAWITATRETPQGQVALGLAMLVVAVYAAYFLRWYDAAIHVGLMLGAYAGALALNPNDGGIFFDVLVSVTIAIGAGVVAWLRQSDRHYRLLVENAPDVVFWTKDGDVQWISPSVESVLGWRDVELDGATLNDLWHPSDREAARVLSDLARAGTAGTGVFRFRTKEGTYAWVEATLKPYVDADGSRGKVGTLRNVSDRVAVEQALAASEAQFRLLSENAADIVLRLDSGLVAWVSPSLTRELGWQPDEWIGTAIATHQHPDDGPVFDALWSKSLAGEPALARGRLATRTGTYRWMEANAAPYVDGLGDIHGIRIAMHAIDDAMAAERELDRRARFDELTGLLNRREMLDRIGNAQHHARRTGLDEALLFCDVDSFKLVNDTCGHGAGDEVLRSIADRIQRTVRSGDLAARVGGDEFVILLRGVRELADALRVSEQIRAAVEVPIVTTAGSIRTTVSIGVTLVVPGEDLDQLVSRADEGMYAAKREGRNQVVGIAG